MAENEKVTAEELNRQQPELVQTLRVEGATAERERILAIQGLPVKTDAERELLAKWMADPEMDHGQAAAALLNAREERETKAKSEALAALKSDEDELKAPKPSSDSDPDAVDAVVQRVLTAGRPTARA